MRHPSFILLLSSLLVLSCTPQTSQPALQTSFYIYRFNPPALIEFSTDFQRIGDIPFSIPPNCGLFNVFPAPLGQYMAIELSCPNGQTVLFLDVATEAVTQPVSDSDSHFLAWTFGGHAAYLKVDSLGSPRILQVSMKGAQAAIPISEYTYDLAAADQGKFIFTFSRGLGLG